MFMRTKIIFFSAVWLLLLPMTLVARELPDFASLIEEKSKAVVKITTQATVNTRSRQFPGQPEFDVPEPFRRFFENDPRLPPERNIGGIGSGFIISKDGYILTNNHVVDGADQINVQMLDRREFIAEVIGSDPRSDLALLKIDSENLPYLSFAKPDNIKVGEWVVAIGSPFDLDFSASQGIVSAIGRSIGGGDNGNYIPFIQTDVAINPGNSGGPLFNLDGEVVGINAQIYTRSGGYMGLSFAIPTSVALSVVEQLKDKGRVDRGWLGVSIRDVNRDEAIAFGLKRPMGALVEQLVEDGPAQEYGIKPGDIIIKFNGVDINQSGDLPHVVGQTPPGRKIPVRIMREKEERSIDVVIGTLESTAALGQVTPESVPQQPEVQAGRLGLVVENLPPEIRDTLETKGGVVVAQVEPDKPGAAAGVRRGDVIVLIDWKEVPDVNTYQDVVNNLPSGSLLTLRLFRQGAPRFITFKIED
jgi:serine protease Do